MRSLRKIQILVAVLYMDYTYLLEVVGALKDVGIWHQQWELHRIIIIYKYVHREINRECSLTFFDLITNSWKFWILELLNI